MIKFSRVKIVPVILALALVFSSCAKPEAPSQTDEAPAVTPAPSEEDAGLDAADIPEVQISDIEKEALEALTPVYDSLMCAMRDLPPERDFYDSQNNALFWSALYYLCTNYGPEDDRNTVDQASIKVPKYVMEEYASACFGDVSELIDLPEENYGITYDTGKQEYTIGLSDKGDEYAKAIKFNYGITGGFEVTVASFGIGEEYPVMLNSYVFIVSPNLGGMAEAGSQEARFSYSVMFAYPDYTDIVHVKDAYEKDGKYYAVLDPVVIIHHSEMDLDETGKPYGYSWKEPYNEKEENIEYLISEYAEFTFSDFNLLFEDVDMEKIVEDNIKFFVDNAKRQFEGKHLVFRVNLHEGVLHSGAFETENYVVG